MAGWNLKRGVLSSEKIFEEKYWSLFNYVFSNSCSKRNTYKYGLIKSILDNLFNFQKFEDYYYISYYNIFSKFAENYWNLVLKHKLRQMRPDGRSFYSAVETILNNAVSDKPILSTLEFEAVYDEDKKIIIQKISAECKKYVIGALYTDFEGVLYGFDLKGDGLKFNCYAYDFLLKYKTEIESLNYYSWAKFLESVNEEHLLVGVLNKLELSTPQRSDLSIYREILRNEFEQNNCFYCGKKLSTIHVDHFIPWTFVKEDKIWNFVLACPDCNKKKSDKLPSTSHIQLIQKRNIILQSYNNTLVSQDFKSYSDSLIPNMWKYAQMSGFKEID